MVSIVYTPVMTKNLIGCLHLTCEKALMETGQTYDCLILDGRREHEASLANMALTL